MKTRIQTILPVVLVLWGTCFTASTVAAGISSYERQIVAAVLVLEASSEGEEGMRAVLHVINNRSQGRVERIPGVVAKHKAFSCLNGITWQQHPDYGPAIGKAMKDRTWPLALQLVDQLLAGQLGRDTTYGATHYCISPPASWQQRMTYLARIGSHRFFIE